MKIKRLVLKNFRGIREMDLELDEKLTVFAGLNGAGKSSILAAMAFPLSAVLDQPPFCEAGRASGVKNSDISDGESWSSASVFLDWNRNSDVPDVDLSVHRDAIHGLNEPATLELVMDAKVERMKEELRRDPTSSASLLAIRYLPERSIAASHAEPPQIDVMAPNSAYSSALNCGRELSQFFNWFKKMQHADSKRLEVPWAVAFEMLKNGDRPPGTHAHLHATRASIAAFMQGNGLYYDDDEDAFFVHKGGQRLSIDQLSGGEKGLLGLVGDLTRRLAVTHPHLTGSDELLQETEAVVMIDEMELHLHPSWQRMVVPRLVETFPNVQFIITTHSPQVLGEVRSENIVLLEDTAEGIQYRRFSREVFGMTSNHILEALMETPERTPKVRGPVSEAYEAVERGDIPRAKELLAKLSEEAKDIAEIERIAMRIRRKETIGK